MIDIIHQNERLVDSDRLLTPAEVAAVFRVDKRTPGEWARAGRLASVRTPGGHHRYRESAVRALLAEGAEGVAL